jgi:hypothetical protein
MARAAQVGSLPHRRKVKAKLVAVVDLAEYQRTGSSQLVLQRGDQSGEQIERNRAQLRAT